MNKRQFKAGDLVYYPQMGCGIFSLQAVRKSIMYPIKICRDDFAEFLTEDGKLYDHDQAAMIFHATPFDVTTGEPITQINQRMASLSVPHYNC